MAEASQVGEVRRLAQSLAHQVGFDDTCAGKVALVATEAATNLVKHAKECELLIRVLDPACVELIALDKVPWMAHFERFLADGTFHGGTSGAGLGAIARHRRLRRLFARPARVAVRCLRDAAPAPGRARRRPRADAAGMCAAISGTSAEVPSGAVMVVDGLGHESRAAQAAGSAASSENLRRGQRARRHPRGVAELPRCRGSDYPRRLPGRSVRYGGIGSIVGAIFANEKHHNLVSHNTARFRPSSAQGQEFTYDFPAGALQ